MSTQDNDAPSTSTSTLSLETVRLYCERNEVNLRLAAARCFSKLAVAVLDGTGPHGFADNSEIKDLSTPIEKLQESDTHSWMNIVGLPDTNEFSVEITTVSGDDTLSSYLLTMEFGRPGIVNVEPFDDPEHTEA